MNTEEAKAIIDRHIMPLMEAFGVSDWRLRVEYDRLDSDNRGDTLARVSSTLDYRKATITIDPGRHDTEEALIESLRHELIHLVLAPFDLFIDVVAQHVPEGDAWRAVSRVKENSVESCVRNIERMLQGWTYPRGDHPVPAPE